MSNDTSLVMRYFGALGLLTECSPFVDDETRELIEIAFNDAVENHDLQWRRFGNRIVIEANINELEAGTS